MSKLKGALILAAIALLLTGKKATRGLRGYEESTYLETGLRPDPGYQWTEEYEQYR